MTHFFLFQERSGTNNSYDHNKLTLQYKLDNEFELVFVVAFQKILKLAYVDKFLNDIHLEFRDKYKNELQNTSRNSFQFEFQSEYTQLLEECEEWGRVQAKLPKQMRSYEDSFKSKKTVASMIERKGGDEKDSGNGKKSVKIIEARKEKDESPQLSPNGGMDEDTILANRKRLAEKLSNKKKPVVEAK